MIHLYILWFWILSSFGVATLTTFLALSYYPDAPFGAIMTIVMAIGIALHAIFYFADRK